MTERTPSPLPDGTTLRPIRDGDERFLFGLFEQTSERTLGLLPLPLDQKRQMVEMQFAARNSGWRQAFPGGSFRIILVDGIPAGEWYTDGVETGDRICLVNAALLEEYRGRGIIAALTRQLMATAAAMGKPLDAHVEIGNPAQEIWMHLGFRIVEDTGAYYRLEYRNQAE